MGKGGEDISSAHRAGGEADTADPVEIPLELLPLAHARHVPLILIIATGIADERRVGGADLGLFLLLERHRCRVVLQWLSKMKGDVQ